MRELIVVLSLLHPDRITILSHPLTFDPQEPVLSVVNFPVNIANFDRRIASLEDLVNERVVPHRFDVFLFICDRHSSILATSGPNCVNVFTNADSSGPK